MRVRDRLATIAKVFGSRTPADMAAGEQAAQMTPSNPFSPGQPIGPYDGYSRTPRSHNFVTGYNISARPKSHERVSFDTLRGLVDAYDVAQMCIWHRIDSIRALDWSLVPARGFSGDADALIDQGMAVLEKPDRQKRFKSWLATYLYDVLAYDAGALYRMRNRGGRAIGLRVVDGTTIAPLLDYWGNSPEPPTEAYVQYANGLPWGWLTRNDLIYEPFRPRSNSMYGTAPLESILLNANTDLRFQQYFLQRFTDGNIPAAFASAPETWTPQQIEEFQALWDAVMMGDQSAKSQIRWIPGGSSFEWSNEKEFSDSFSLFLMRKTCAAYHVVPSDLGFTENVNRSSGETQADVQHRVGDLPLVNHIAGILTDFLKHDMGLPLEFTFDTGQEKEDRLALAQAWQIYIESGMASSDEGREQLLGLPGDPTRPTPRFFSTTRLGPVPLLAIEGVAGKVDPETFGPSADQPVLPQPFVPPPGVVPAAGTTDAKASEAAEDAYQVRVRHELHADAVASQAASTGGAVGGAPMAKDGAPAAPTAGITTGTGLAGYDLAGRNADEDEEEKDAVPSGPGATPATLAKREATAFRRFRQARRRDGKWRDFEFRHTDPVTAHRLNDSGRLAVRKAGGEVAVAGLAVHAADTGRVLMLQRALDDTDPAAGCWEFPGGHLEGDETPLQGAWREWAEETGCIPPPGQQTGTWTSSNGIYRGIVWTVPDEAHVPIGGDRDISNPDDPDGDHIEAIAWWDPAQLVDNPAVRTELLDSLPDVLAALGGTPVAKAGDSGVPKAGEGGQWPGWQLDLEAAAYWALRIAEALGSALGTAQAQQLARDYASQHPAAASPDDSDDKDDRDGAIAAALVLLSAHVALAGPLAAVLAALYTDGYLIGAASAVAAVDGGTPDLGDWTPGDTTGARARIEALGAGAGLTALTGTAATVSAGVAATRLRHLAGILADGVRRGDTPAAIAQALSTALTDPDRANTVASTETTRASSAAAQDAYQLREIPLGQWVLDPGNPCPICTANAAADARPIGDPYPSGHATPPVHPRCRCALLPA